MAHEITERKDGTHEAMFVGEKPWHGLGTMLDEMQTPEEALEKAKLDWEVEKRLLRYRRIIAEGVDGGIEAAWLGEINDRFAMVRADTQEYLGVVGGRYVPVQNKEQADFIEALVGEGEAVVECAGSLFGGRKTFWTCKLPNNIVINEDDSMEKYLIFSNDHSGRGSFTAYFTTTRVVCNNTLQLSSHQSFNRVSIRHSGDIKAKIAEARKVLGLSQELYTQAEDNYKYLADIDIDPVLVKDLLMQSFGLDENSRKSTLKGINKCYEQEKAIAKNPNSAWTLYNGVTRYTTHIMGRSRDKRFDSLLDGKAARVNSDAMRLMKAAGTLTQ